MSNKTFNDQVEVILDVFDNMTSEAYGNRYGELLRDTYVYKNNVKVIFYILDFWGT